MSKKNPPSDSGFGDLEDDFFNQGGGDAWGTPTPDPEAARKAEQARVAEEARLAAEVRIAEQKRAEQARIAEEARATEQARVAAEEARVAAEAKRAEEARIAAEAMRAEEARIAEAKRAEDARIAAEAARQQEEARVAAEAARQVEAARVAAETARRAEEARVAAEAASKAEDDWFSGEETRRVEDERAAGAAREVEAARVAAEAARHVEEARIAADTAQKAEEARIAAEAAQKAEEARVAAEAAREADEAWRAAEAAREAEVQRVAAEAARAEEARLAAEDAGRTEEVERPVKPNKRGIAASVDAGSARKGISSNPTIVADRAELIRQFAAEATEDLPIASVEVAAVVAEEPAAAETATEASWTETEEAQDAGPVLEIGASGTWAAAITMLQREAGRAEGPARTALFVAAAELARTRGGNAESARALLDAAAGGARRPANEAGEAWWAERVTTVAALGDDEALSAALEGHAAALTGGAASDALIAAASVARGSLKRDDLASAELERAASVGDDLRALLALVELHQAQGEYGRQAAALARLAAQFQGGAAAALLAERAQVLQRGGAPSAELAGAWKETLTADPSSAAAFLAMERHYRQAGEWVSLGGLYRSEAERLLADATLSDAARGAEAAWWFGRAARVYRLQLFDEGRAAECYVAGLAASPGALELRHEYGVFCAEAERWEDLAASLAAEIESAPAHGKSFLQYRLARLTEDRLGRVEEALALFRLSATDAAAAPAAEAVLRILQQGGRWTELVAFLDERLGHLDDPSLMVTVLYRMGETCEGPLDDQAGARKHFERILDVAPGYLPALEGLERVYTRLSAWADLAAVYEQRALLAEEPGGVALQRHRAGAVYDFRLQDADRAREQYRLALEAVADFPPSLDAYARSLEARQEWAFLGKALRAGAGATRDANEAVSLYYRAGRVLADRTDEIALAMGCLQRCLELSPGFLPAVLLLKELAARQGDWSEYFRLERGQADMGEDLDRRHWRLLAAAEAAQRLPDADPAQIAAEVLREDPAQPAAIELAERVAIANGDQAGLMELYLRLAAAATDEAERVRYCGRVAELAADQGASEALLSGLSEVLAATGVASRPLRSLARVAEAAGYPEEALRALGEAGGEGREGAWLRGVTLGDTAGAVRILAPLVEERKDAAAAVMLLRLTALPALRARAHMVLAESAADQRAQGLHALLAAPAFDAAGLSDEALDAWRMAFRADPRSGDAMTGLRAALVSRADADGLRALYAALPAPSAAGLGEALEAVGDIDGAIAVWRDQLASSEVPLPWSVRLEQALSARNEWKQVFELLQARIAGASRETRAEITLRSRWLLAEKLAESEEAWDFYRQLHDSAPNDVEVLEALARIAGARGETALSVRYLAGLAEHAESPRDAARFHRRTAETLERAGDSDGARAALTRALDSLPDDQEALGGLRRLAEAAGDWQGVVGVLARQAALSSGRPQIDRFAEIARLWEARLSDRAVAADAWRKVLDLAPDDEEALTRLVALSDESGDWAGFVEHGQMLLRLLEGADRSVLQRRIGVALAEHLRREDEAIRFLDAASGGPAPDVEAARHLERIHLGRGEWDRVVDALLRRARSTADVAERADALANAARIRVETLRDRAGAADIYDELLKIEPEHPEALRYRGEFLYESGRIEEAVVIFERMETHELARDVDDFDAQVEVSMYFYRFAEALRRLGRTEDAILRYERALALNATHLPSLEAVGPMYMAASDWVKADKVWKQLLQLTGGHGNPEQLARIYASLGTVEHRLGQPEKARKRFTKALELRPNDIAALRGYGAVLFAAEDWNNLLNIFNNIIYHTQDPSDVIDAYLNKGFVLDARLGLPEKAAQHYEKSLAFDPGQPQALLRLAELALRRQDWPEAASLADRGLQIQDEAPLVRSFLLLVRSIAYQACGDGRAAMDGYKSAIVVDPGVVATLGGATIEDYEKVHEILRSRLQSAQRL
ncbi:MAG: hypothetical protein Q8P41_10095 [Pseudomonadota bacterium]|nr:hypothetical protein [Pseudomonadota bacterium]